MGNVKNGKFVYKNDDSIKKMHEFYDKTLLKLMLMLAEQKVTVRLNLIQWNGINKWPVKDICIRQ